MQLQLSSQSSSSPRVRPSPAPPPAAAPPHSFQSHQHHGTVYQLSSAASSSASPSPPRGPAAAPAAHHPHALSLSTLPSYLSPTFQPSHPKPSPSHKPPPASDGNGKEFYASASGFPYRAHAPQPLLPWRLTERRRTLGVCLLVCLNGGVAPPDADYSSSSSTLCYAPIVSSPPAAAASTVAERLQSQYERWQPKARYRQLPDPTPAECKKALTGLRRQLSRDRLLLHYCGYGAPRATRAGELWAFNRQLTQYLPVGLREMLGWSHWPLVLVVEAGGAGHVLEQVRAWTEQGKSRTAASSDDRDRERDEEDGSDSGGREPGRAATILSSLAAASAPSSSSPSSSSPQPSSAASAPASCPAPGDVIVLAACGAEQSLALHPLLPADLLTCCLTTPLSIALRHFALQSPLVSIAPHHLDLIPGSPADRRTPLGELHWIFTAITDSIAFASFPPSVFSALFRSDLLVASLFRNFLLAQRVLPCYGATPCSLPALASTHKHPLWEAWDAVVESHLLHLQHCLKQSLPFPHSLFFSEQLAAFELTLDILPAASLSSSAPPPLQLPVVLQVLLSPSHRRRALVLLARFLQRGRGSVQQVLDVGIFPYVLKLLEAGAQELREVLAFIWSRIIAADPSVADELLKEGGWRFFADGVQAQGAAATDRQRALCLHVLSLVCHQLPAAQATIGTPALLNALTAHLESDNALVRRWTLLLLAQLLHHNAAVSSAVPSVSEHAALLCFDWQPEVRAAAVFALSCMLEEQPASSGLPSSSSFSSTSSRSSPPAAVTPSLTPPASPLDDEQHASHSLHLLSLFRLLCHLCNDGSALVREELAVALGVLVDSQLEEFRAVARDEEAERERERGDGERGRRDRDEQQAARPLPPLAPLTPTATQRSVSPLVSPLSSARKLQQLFHSPAPHGHRGSSSSQSPHSSSPSPSPPPSAAASFSSSTLSLPLSRAFTEPPHSLSAGRPVQPPSLVLSPSGGSSVSLSSLPDSSRPPSPAVTALSSMASMAAAASLSEPPASSSSASSWAFLTPPRPLRLSGAVRESLSPQQQRQIVWRAVRLLCQDAMPSVAAAAVSSYRKITAPIEHRREPAAAAAAAAAARKNSPLLTPTAWGNAAAAATAAAAMAEQEGGGGGAAAAGGDGGGVAQPPSNQRSVSDGRSSPPSASLDSASQPTAERKDSDGRRGQAALSSSLRRIASAASNMAHAASHHHSVSLFSIPASASASSLSREHESQLLQAHGHSQSHHSSSSQSSPLQSASSSPQVSAFAPASSQLSMLSLLSAPVASSIVERSADSFLQPAGAESCGDEPEDSLLLLLQREYRRRQVEQMQRAEAALQQRQDRQPALELLCTLPSSLDSVSCLLWHPYQPLLVACDARRSLVCLDWQRRERRGLFSNDNRPGSRVASMAFINPSAVSLLATGTDSGEVRVWRRPHSRQPQLVNAWMGVKAAGSGRGCSMSIEWMQAQGWMACAGGSDVVSVWDVEREACVMDLPVEDSGAVSASAPQSVVTCLSSSSSSPLLFSGGSDGSLRCFDLRSGLLSSSFTICRQQSAILRCQYSRGQDAADDGAISCASRDGDILRADLRFVVNRDDGSRERSGMTTLTLSPAQLPAAARTGSPSPSAASTAGSVSSVSGSGSMQPSPLLFPLANPSPMSSGSSPSLQPHSSSSSPSPSSSSPPLLASASPVTHLTAFPPSPSLSAAAPVVLTAFAAHPSIAVYAAVSSSRQLRAFSGTATLLSSSQQHRGGAGGGAGGGGAAAVAKSSPGHRRTGGMRGGRDSGRGGAGAAGGGAAGAGISLSSAGGDGGREHVTDCVSWHPSLLLLAVSSGGGDISLYGPAGSATVAGGFTSSAIQPFH